MLAGCWRWSGLLGREGGLSGMVLHDDDDDDDGGMKGGIVLCSRDGSFGRLPGGGWPMSWCCYCVAIGIIESV